MENKYFINRRRIRANEHIRELAASVFLNHKEFIQPLFIDESIKERTAINSLTDVNKDTIETMLQQMEADIQSGINKFLLFPIPVEKATKVFNYQFVTKALSIIKSRFGNAVWVAADTCLCAYTLHGHCGILSEDQKSVLNHESVNALADYALQMVQAGADCIAPSDMMDGRISAIRHLLDQHGFDATAILSYSAKFSSQFYGPFRDACNSTPGQSNLLKDRKTYQSSPFNAEDAILSTLRDIEEGADLVMVKPAVSYLDVIYRIKQVTQVPLAAYHVSGEYQSLELLAQQGLVERNLAHIEVWTALKRAGADCIISYASRYAKGWIEKIDY